MANYNCTVRTNYFRVDDPEAFRTFMSSVYGSEDSVELWEETDDNGVLRFGFGCYGGIGGLASEDEGEDENEDVTDYDAFIDGLQKHVAADDAVLIFESGNEKLRYVIGSVLVVTRDRIEYREITDVGATLAAEMLGNPSWKTRVDY